MTIPPRDDFHRLGTQRFADELEPLDSPSTDLAAPPAHWATTDEEPLSSPPGQRPPRHRETRAYGAPVGTGAWSCDICRCE